MSSILTIFGTNYEYIPANKGLNFIVCESYEEVFIGVYQLNLNGTTIVGEHVDTINGEPVVKLTTTLEGKEYDVLFVVKQGEPNVILNESSLHNGRKTYIAEKQLVEQVVVEEEVNLPDEPIIEEKTAESVKVDIERYKADAVKAINENFTDKRAKIQDLKNGLVNLIEEKLAEVKTATTTDIDAIKSSLLENVKSELANHRATSAEALTEINNAKSDVITSLEGYVLRVESTAAEASKSLEEFKNDVVFNIDTKLSELDAINEAAKNNVSEALNSIHTIAESTGESLKSISTESQTSINEAKDQVVGIIVEKIAELQKAADIKLGEISTIVNEKVDTINNITRRVEQLRDDTLEEFKDSITESVSKKIKDIELVAPKKADLDKLKKQLEQRIELESTNLKKFVSSYGGGGSVAQQFAEGGTMNGTLNVATGQILSGGTDLFNIFATAGGGYQTLSFNDNNAELTIAPLGNTISLSALSGGGGGTATGAYLPLSGGTLTGDLRIDADITSVDSIQFNLTAGATTAIGQLAWNAAESTLDLGVNSDVTLQLGQETIIQVKNTSGETIRNGWAVYASGASGVGSGNITVSAYRGNFGGVNDLYLLGVATQEMADNDFGFVTTIGKVRDVIVSEVQESTDVSSWDIGTILYVSATERGRFTSVAPLPPNEILPIAIVVGVNGTKRTFFVRSEHGYTLNELHNVYVLSATNGQTITWDAANNYWKNTTPYSGSDIKALTGNWQSTYSTVGTNSASWSSAYTTINSQSAANASVYSTVNANSAVQWNYQGTDIKALTGNWQNTYTNFSGQSANNASVYTTVQAYSAVWGDTAYLPLSGGTLTGTVSTNSDIEITDSTKGVILRSPNNTKYRITVTNAGELVTTPV